MAPSAQVLWVPLHSIHLRGLPWTPSVPWPVDSMAPSLQWVGQLGIRAMWYWIWASRPWGQAEKVPSTGTLGTDSTGQDGKEGPLLSSLVPPSSPPFLGTLSACPWQRAIEEASNCGWLLRLTLASEVPLLAALVVHYHGQGLDSSRYRIYPKPPCISGGRTLSTWTTGWVGSPAGRRVTPCFVS